MHAVDDTYSSEKVNLLVERAVGGDAEAFGSLYDIFVDRIYQHVYYRVRNKDDAEDITQQVFIRAWKAIKKYRITSKPFIAWILKISQNLIKDFYRSRKITNYIDPDFEIPGSDESPGRQAESEYEQKELRRIIYQLPLEQQQVIMMKFLEGFSYAEIAASLEKTEGAIRVIQHRALKKMRTMLEEEKNSQ